VVPERVGLLRLLRATRDPDVQAGLAVGLEVLRAVGASRSRQGRLTDDTRDVPELGPRNQREEE